MSNTETPKSVWKAEMWDQHILIVGKIAIVLEGVPDKDGYKFQILCGATHGSASASYHTKAPSLIEAKAVAVRCARKLLTAALAALPE